MLSRLLSGDEGEVGPPGYEGIREISWKLL